MSRFARSVCGLALALCILQATPLVIAQSQDLIVDICTTPNRYWNKQVLLKGHVIRVTPDPPGTNRGSYTLRDQSDNDIEVATGDLPAQGKVYVVKGIVEQSEAGDNVPIVREGSRTLGQPDSSVTAPSAPTTAPAASPAAGAAASPAAPAAGRAISKSEVEEAVRKELEKAKAETAASPAAATPSPVPATPARAPATPSLLENPLVIGVIVVAVVAIIGIIIIVTRSKAAPPTAYAPAPPQTAASSVAAAQPNAAAFSATQVANAGATMAASSRGTEVFTRLGGELTVAEGPDRGRTLAIGKPVITIGRSGQRKNDLELSDSTVSREQAKVLYNNADRAFKVVNESTTNPTRVNGATVDAAVLQDGDRLEFGNTVVKFKKT